MPDDFARSIQNIERDLFLRRSLQIIIDDRARRRVIADWLALVEFLRIIQNHWGLGLIKDEIFRRRLRNDLAQRRDVVEYPERPAMSCHDEIVILYHEIVNR